MFISEIPQPQVVLSPTTWVKLKMKHFNVRILPCLFCALLARKTSCHELEMPPEEVSIAKAVEIWPPATKQGVSVNDLHNEYNHIFQRGNRNAASHRWSTFLLERASQMTPERIDLFFTGFCVVSGSPVRPSDYNRYRLTLPKVGGGQQEFYTGYLHYCCWPCVCDTQDFIRVDTRNVTTNDGITRVRNFAVIGNPCDNPEQLDAPFEQPYGRRYKTTLSETAREIHCLEGGVLEGATLSDHGFVIIGMFLDSADVLDASGMVLNSQQTIDDPTPGRISTSAVDGTLFQDEREWGPQCQDRANKGYNSGMGEIFRKVCAISPITDEKLQLEVMDDNQNCGNSEEGNGTQMEQ